MTGDGKPSGGARCPACEAAGLPGARYCGACGQALPGAPARPWGGGRGQSIGAAVALAFVGFAALTAMQLTDSFDDDGYERLWSAMVLGAALPAAVAIVLLWWTRRGWVSLLVVPSAYLVLLVVSLLVLFFAALTGA